ncbi:MAG: TIGR03667 family PPOX class F420-dependent oxidoreductase [Anaerolineales bacterium]|nr:TIGR03667 family PPOX class F420-dependent oxidoreductase [Anaerolineales bacterium]
MSDPKTKLERKAKSVIKKEYVIWLTTVDINGTPQPRPVWFIWDNDAFLIYSKPTAHKLKHIRENGNVSLHFNTDETGDKDVIVYIGKAELDTNAAPPNKVPAYLRKYRKGIKDIGMTVEQFTSEYSVAIRIKPTSLRGW